jgi:hypothetical protein
MWEPQPLTTLRSSKSCRGENFTFFTFTCSNICLPYHCELMLNYIGFISSGYTYLSQYYVWPENCNEMENSAQLFFFQNAIDYVLRVSRLQCCVINVSVLIIHHSAQMLGKVEVVPVSKHQIMKAYGGVVVKSQVWWIFLLDPGSNAQPLAPVNLPPRKECTAITESQVWTLCWGWALWKCEEFHPLPEFQPRSFSPWSVIVLIDLWHVINKSINN